jgi:hypothetical protein
MSCYNLDVLGRTVALVHDRGLSIIHSCLTYGIYCDGPPWWSLFLLSSR